MRGLAERFGEELSVFDRGQGVPVTVDDQERRRMRVGPIDRRGPVVFLRLFVEKRLERLEKEKKQKE